MKRKKKEKEKQKPNNKPPTKILPTNKQQTKPTKQK